MSSQLANVFVLRVVRAVYTICMLTNIILQPLLPSDHTWTEIKAHVSTHCLARK